MKLVFLLCLGTGFALGAPPVNLPAKPAVVSEAQVDTWVRTWQRRLSLEDWEISAQIVRSSELKPDTLGNLKWNSASKTATVRVLNPVDYDLPPAEIPTDIEYTVVHELIHLQLSVLPRDPGAKETEERVVNRITEALFALDKGSSYRPRSAVIRAVPRGRSSSEASRSSKP